MTLKFNFFYKHSNKDYFLGLLQKVANAHSVEIRAEVRDEILCVFASAENAEILGTFADALESEIPLSLYFRLKSVELYEKPLSAEKVAQNLENIFSVSEINAIKNLSDSRFCDIFGDSTLRVEFCENFSSLRGRIADSHEAIQKNQSARSANPCKSFCYFWLSPKVESPLPLNSNLPIVQGAKKSRQIQSKRIVGDSKVAKMDSSLRATRYAQNDGMGVDYFGDESPRNDESFVYCHDSANAKSRNDEFMRIDSPTSLKNALTNLCDLLSQGQNITLGTSKGAISLSTKSDDFDFILANDISTISLYTRASADELNALASFEKPLLSLNIKEVFAREVGVKTALFILPYDIILCCISSILLNREIAFVYGKKIDSVNLNLVYDSTHKSDFFEIIVGQNGYFLNKNFLDLNANPNGKKLSNLWDFLDFNFDNFNGEVDSTNSDIFIAYLSTKNPTHLANLRTKAQIVKIAFDKNPKNILQKITTLENGDKLIANFKKEFEARFRAIQSLDSTPQMSENIMDIFECAAMILGQKRDKNAIFELAQNYIRDIGPKIDFRNVKLVLDSTNQSRVSTPNLARFVVQKIGFKDAVVPSADFLLESDKRGSPPKSEKRQLLARRGSGAGGAALLRKEICESKSKKIVGDSQVAKMDSSRCRAQNDESNIDCFGDSTNRTRNDEYMHDSPKLPQDEFALFYDESRTIRSIISFTLAGSEPEVIAFGIIESLVDYLILIFRDAQKQFETKNMGIIGDIFANKIFFDKITQKIPKDFNLVFPKFLDIQ